VGFGEIALLYNERRTATVRCVEMCDVWILDGNIFKKIVLRAVRLRRNIELSFLDKVPIFKHLDRYEKLKLVDGLTLL
jgi:CRP-like cAMP-binding protein